ncbi:hypothetical protein BC628DRAFT_726209 [Trametes gibbosa]|nr:hypothetical protein BC628DRAFT_726209 [Trametes gibbosa]UVI59123.1 Zn(2)-Cys(6)21 [Trametes gibbosa]
MQRGQTVTQQGSTPCLFSPPSSMRSHGILLCSGWDSRRAEDPLPAVPSNMWGRTARYLIPQARPSPSPPSPSVPYPLLSSPLSLSSAQLERRACPSSYASTSMPAHTACTNCAERKVRCIPSPVLDGASCQVCLERGVPCIWPTATAGAPGSATRRTSCDFCRMKRHRCNRPAAGAPCSRCTRYRKECTFSQPGTRVLHRSQVLSLNRGPTSPRRPLAAATSANAPGPSTAVVLAVPGHVAPPESAVQHVAGGPPTTLMVDIPAAVAAGDESGPGSATTTTTTSPNRDREWWQVVFAPSPEPNE